MPELAEPCNGSSDRCIYTSKKPGAFCLDSVFLVGYSDQSIC